MRGVDSSISTRRQARSPSVLHTGHSAMPDEAEVDESAPEGAWQAAPSELASTAMQSSESFDMTVIEIVPGEQRREVDALFMWRRTR